MILPLSSRVRVAHDACVQAIQTPSALAWGRHRARGPCWCPLERSYCALGTCIMPLGVPIRRSHAGSFRARGRQRQGECRGRRIEAGMGTMFACYRLWREVWRVSASSGHRRGRVVCSRWEAGAGGGGGGDSVGGGHGAAHDLGSRRRQLARHDARPGAAKGVWLAVARVS